MNTFVLPISPGLHSKIKLELERLGYDLITPMEWRHCRINPRRGGDHAKEWRSFPVFRGYIFANCSLHDLAGIRAVPGVRQPLGRLNEPVPLNARERLALVALDQPKPKPEEPRRIRAGDKVLVHVDGKPGTLREVKKVRAKSMRVIMEFFNGLREVDIPIEKVEAA